MHWTLTIENRATGWLTPDFHHAWQRVLLHASARYDLFAPVYVLMPDHAHLLWLGLHEATSDQRVAIEFLRRHLRSDLSSAEWQHQVHDHVLTESERGQGAFAANAMYVLENPVRARLANVADEWPYTGCCVPGFPVLNPHDVEYWPLFWRIYNRRLSALDSTRSRS